jgi:hypothetical protein
LELHWPWRPDQLGHSGFFVLRTPLLPYDEIPRWSEGPGAERAGRDELRRRLAAAYARPEVFEALRVGSPSLAAAFGVWAKDPDGGRGPGIELALVRFYTRMATRPTPFGLFAGCSVGAVAVETRLVLSGPDHYRRQTRVDADYLARLAGPSFTVTGPGTVSAVAERLAEHPGSSAVGVGLAAVARLLDRLDTAGLAGSDAVYAEASATLAALGDPPPPEFPFDVQLVKPAPSATLGAGVVDELIRGVALLHRLARRRPRPDLDGFRRAFERRYGGRTVPLLVALDPDRGVGFGDPPPPSGVAGWLSPPPASRTPPAWGRREDLLVERLAALAPGDLELALGPADLEAMEEPDPPPLPAALAVLATLAAPSEAAIDRGRFRVLVDVAGGPSGAWLLGRFCHADPRLEEEVRRHLADEEALDPDAAWAEIVHLPAGKFANVVVRPVLRRYEIDCFGPSGAPPAQQLALSDLQLSLREGRLVLRSSRLGCRVIPRMTSAYQADSGPAAFRFLCALQVAEVTGGVAWDWGALDGFPFLPRVTAGRLVLARARWRLRLAEPGGLGAGRIGHPEVDRWRRNRGLPRLVSLVEGDRALLVDFDNLLMAESFAAMAAERGEVVVEEVFPGPEELCVHDGVGRFVHEFVVPLVARRAHSAVEGAAVTSVDDGGEWLAIEVFGPPPVLDGVVASVLNRETDGEWQFQRGNEPDHHLRCVFHCESPTARWTLQRRLEDRLGPFRGDAGIWRVQFAPLVAPFPAFEVETADSAMAAAAIAALGPDGPGSDWRWRFALVALDRLLEDLGLEGEEKLRALQSRRDELWRRLGSVTAWNRQLGLAFRRQQQEVEAWIDALRPGAPTPSVEGLPPPDVRATLAAALRRRSDAVAAAGARPGLPALGDACLDRLLPTGDRRQALVVYDFLGRVARSRSARGSHRWSG